jgi:hypothetical protein
LLDSIQVGVYGSIPSDKKVVGVFVRFSCAFRAAQSGVNFYLQSFRNSQHSCLTRIPK